MGTTTDSPLTEVLGVEVVVVAVTDFFVVVKGCDVVAIVLALVDVDVVIVVVELVVVEAPMGFDSRTELAAFVAAELACGVKSLEILVLGYTRVGFGVVVVLDVVEVTRLCFFIFSGFLNFGGGRVLLGLAVVVVVVVLVVVVLVVMGSSLYFSVVVGAVVVIIMKSFSGIVSFSIGVVLVNAAKISAQRISSFPSSE